MKEALQIYMKTHEPNMQASFQCANDEEISSDKGISSDDCHKFTRNVVVTVGKKKSSHSPIL